MSVKTYEYRENTVRQIRKRRWRSFYVGGGEEGCYHLDVH